MQVVTGAHEVALRREIGDVDDQRITLPAATRVAEPLTDGWRKMRAPVHGDDALPPLPLANIVEDRHRAGVIHDAPVATKIWQQGAHATLRHAAVLRAVGAVEASRVVEGRDLRSAWRGRAVLP